MKKILLFCLMALGFHGACNAAITMVNNKGVDVDNSVAEATSRNNLPKKVDVQTQRIEQLHIDGYIDTKYVRLVVDIVNDKRMTGYLFQNDGSKQYIYGEKIYGVLHIYDQGGRHLTVVLDK